MTNTTLARLEELLEGLLEEASAEEKQFKLRTALQLVAVVEQQCDTMGVALEESKLDEEVRENLRELGYIE